MFKYVAGNIVFITRKIAVKFVRSHGDHTAIIGHNYFRRVDRKRES